MVCSATFYWRYHSVKISLSNHIFASYKAHWISVICASKLHSHPVYLSTISAEVMFLSWNWGLLIGIKHKICFLLISYFASLEWRKSVWELLLKNYLSNLGIVILLNVIVTAMVHLKLKIAKVTKQSQKFPTVISLSVCFSASPPPFWI